MQGDITGFMSSGARGGPPVVAGPGRDKAALSDVPSEATCHDGGPRRAASRRSRSCAGAGGDIKSEWLLAGLHQGAQPESADTPHFILSGCLQQAGFSIGRLQHQGRVVQPELPHERR